MKAHVLIVDDDEGLRRALEDRFKYWGHAVTTAKNGEETMTEVGRKSFDLILLDMTMPGMTGLELLDRLRDAGCPAEKVVLTAYGSIQKAVDAMKRGADDFLVKPADFDLLRKVVERSLDRRRMRRTNEALEERVAAASRMVSGGSPRMLELMEMAEQAAQSETTLLLIGESGTGKQVLAEEIHRRSPRAAGPFVYINCVAISDELIESTLFGHERGAFTGAVARKEGRLEAAAGGTAFLDEVGDISPRLQTKLLHFLEAGEFERVGGTQSIAVDCRIIAATNRDLAQDVREHRFREDLYYRINVITMRIPPLRDRPEEIAPLAEEFTRRFAGELKREGLRLDPRTLEVMHRYTWPGNVRQLKNAVERMAVLTRGQSLTPDLLPPEVLSGSGAREEDLLDLPYKHAVARFKHRLIHGALDKTGGNQTRAAELLGLQRTYLNRLLKEIEEGGIPDE